MPSIPKPESKEYNPFYETYISKIDELNIGSMLNEQMRVLEKTLTPISPENESFRYAPGKWSVKEVVRHICDAERVFAYRAMCIARGENINLPGFDQNQYAANSTVDHLSLIKLVDELSSVRQSTMHLVTNMEENAWKQVGLASGSPVSTRALMYMLVGHFEHHLGILNERYLPAIS